MPKTECGFSDTVTGVSGSGLLINQGPTLRVDVGFDPTWKLAFGTFPIAGINDVEALVDTGATESCIDDLLASKLVLPIIDKRKICGSSGEHEVNVYLAQIRIPSLNFVVYGAFAGVALAAGGQRHQVLMGRTFLSKFKMIYDGVSGRVTISSD
ncbi:MAG: aspartyl protease family protein [Bacteroidota bacterium]